MRNKTVTVPDLGGATDVEVIELCVAIGDSVTQDQSLIVVESDKASMDIPSPFDGVVVTIAVAEGAVVSDGDIILELSPSSSPSDQSSPAESEMVASVGSDVDVACHNSESGKQEEAEVALGAESAQRIGVSGEKLQTVVVPDLGGADRVELIEIAVAVGDHVTKGDSLLVMESDKASMEFPSPYSGVVQQLHVKDGDSLSQGVAVLDLHIDLSVIEENVAAETAVEKVLARLPPTQASSVSRPGGGQPVVESDENERAPVYRDRRRSDIYAGPAVRKLARELGVDLRRVSGSGPRNRIAKEDLTDFVKRSIAASSSSAIAAVPAVDFSQFGEIDSQPMSKLHKATAANMQRSWLNVPHVTQFDEADITDLEDFRASIKAEMVQRNIKVTPIAFIFKAVATALRDSPKFNASLSADGQSLIYKGYVNIGMAVDTTAGLVVPVLRDVDQKGIWQLSQEISELADRARQRKLKPLEMQGGCFTISSLGAIGGMGFTPIVNSPEVGILGVSKMSIKPIYIDDKLQPRKLLPLSLSYDHRAVNGGDAGRFFTLLTALLGDVRRLTLD